MFRITPNGDKDLFYFKRICAASDFHRWVADAHTNIILWNEDSHIFHWNDVDIPLVYGVNEPGKWSTEVKIAYIEEGENEMKFAKGETEISFEI